MWFKWPLGAMMPPQTPGMGLRCEEEPRRPGFQFRPATIIYRPRCRKQAARKAHKMMANRFDPDMFALNQA